MFRRGCNASPKNFLAGGSAPQQVDFPTDQEKGENRETDGIRFLPSGLLLGAGGFFYLRDTTAPQLGLRPGSGPISNKRPPVLDLQDPGSGLKSVQVTWCRAKRRRF